MKWLGIYSIYSSMVGATMSFNFARSCIALKKEASCFDRTRGKAKEGIGGPNLGLCLLRSHFSKVLPLFTSFYKCHHAFQHSALYLIKDNGCFNYRLAVHCIKTLLPLFQLKCLVDNTLHIDLSSVCNSGSVLLERCVKFCHVPR